MSLPMEFWGVEVKAGQPLKVDTDGKLLHLSQASLGESKSRKRSDFVPIHVKFGDQKLVLGTLSPETIPQLSFDLVFEKEFELFHDWKNGSVYFCGYLSSVPEYDGFSEEDSDSDTEEEDELDLPATAAENGNVKSKPVTAGAKQNQQPKPKVSLVEPTKVDQDDDSDDDSDDDDDDNESSDSEADSDDEDDSDEDVTPKKAESGKKRPVEPAAKTPTPNKKAKAFTPQRTGDHSHGDGKKGVHTATPYPAKQTVKQDKSKDQPQKSPGQLICKSCNKTFNSDNALKAHSASKHGAK